MYQGLKKKKLFQEVIYPLKVYDIFHKDPPVEATHS
jgi:hypothetical protein